VLLLLSPQVQDPKPIKDWEYRKFEDGRLLGIFKGKEAKVLAKGEYKIRLPSAVLYLRVDRSQLRRIRLSAREGYYSENKKLFTFRKDSLLEFEDGTCFRTEEFTIRFRLKSLTTSRKFIIKTPTAVIEGIGLEADQGLGRLFIKKDVLIIQQLSSGMRRSSAKSAWIFLEEKDGKKVIKSIHARGGVRVSEGDLKGVAEELSWERSNGLLKLYGGGFSKFIKGPLTMEAPFILLTKAPQRIFLAGPKKISFREFLITSWGIASFYPAEGILKIQQRVRLKRKKNIVFCKKLLVKFSKDTPLKLIAYFAKIRKGKSLQIFCDIFERDFSDSKVVMKGKPYVLLERKNSILKTEVLVIDEDKRIILGESRGKRSMIIFDPSR
jgi:hypothetical protein